MSPIKRDKPFSKEYYPVILALEDLEEIYQTLEHDGGEITISTEEYNFKTIDDAAKHYGKKPIYELNISSYRPYVSLELNRSNTKLYVGGPKGHRLYYELDKVLERRQRRFRYLYSFWLAVAPLATNVITLIGTPGAVLTQEVASFAAVLWFLWVSFVRLRRHSVVRFQRQSETPPFWERNRDQLLISVILALVGGAITLLVQKLIPAIHF